MINKWILVIVVIVLVGSVLMIEDAFFRKDKYKISNLKDVDGVLIILSYNQMYGGDGESLFGFLRTHFWHFMGDPERIAKSSDIQRTLKMVDTVDPDILALNEILGVSQREEFIEELSNRGYTSFHTGLGHGWTKNDELVVETLLATKMKSETIEMDGLIELPPYPGNSGGMAHVYIPEIDTDVLQVHLAHSSWEKRKPSFDNQVEVISEIFADKLKGSRVIFMGDFNNSSQWAFETFDYLEDFEKLSSDGATCSATLLLRYFSSKSLDHIFGKGFDLVENGIVLGESDHKGVWVQVKLVD